MKSECNNGGSTREIEKSSTNESSAPKLGPLTELCLHLNLWYSLKQIFMHLQEQNPQIKQLWL